MTDNFILEDLYPIEPLKIIQLDSVKGSDVDERKTHPWYEDLQEYTERYYDDDSFDFCSHHPF